MQAYLDVLKERAFEKGEAKAQVILGDLLCEGWTGVVDQDYKEALDLYERAALQKSTTAQCILGFLYKHGIGVQVDIEKSAKWYALAANLGSGDAINALDLLPPPPPPPTPPILPERKYRVAAGIKSGAAVSAGGPAIPRRRPLGR